MSLIVPVKEKVSIYIKWMYMYKIPVLYVA